MPDSHKPELPSQHDIIDLVLRHCGVNTPELDRLARLATDMQHLEWQLARRASVRKENAAAAGNAG